MPAGNKQRVENRKEVREMMERKAARAEKVGAIAAGIGFTATDRFSSKMGESAKKLKDEAIMQGPAEDRQRDYGKNLGKYLQKKKDRK